MILLFCVGRLSHAPLLIMLLCYLYVVNSLDYHVGCLVNVGQHADEVSWLFFQCFQPRAQVGRIVLLDGRVEAKLMSAHCSGQLGHQLLTTIRLTAERVSLGDPVEPLLRTRGVSYLVQGRGVELVPCTVNLLGRAALIECSFSGNRISSFDGM